MKSRLFPAAGNPLPGFTSGKPVGPEERIKGVTRMKIEISDRMVL